MPRKQAVQEEKPAVKAAEPMIQEEPVRDGEVIGGGVEEMQAIPMAGTDGDTVVVCLNYPRDVKYLVPDGRGKMRPIVFNGNAGYLKGKEKGVIPVGAFGITTGVPRETWEWIESHRPDDALIRKGLLFASTPTKARDEVKERTELRHGYEPVNPDKAGNTRPYNA